MDQIYNQLSRMGRGNIFPPSLVRKWFVFFLPVIAFLYSNETFSQYRKMNFATSVLSSSGNVANASGAVGFNPSPSQSVYNTAATLTAGTGNTASISLGLGTTGNAGDTIYLKIGAFNNGASLSRVQVQPLLGSTDVGVAGTPFIVNFPQTISDGTIYGFKATAGFDGVKITLNGGTTLLIFNYNFTLYEAYFKGGASQWPQDCDKAFETSTITNGFAPSANGNQYLFIDNVESSYSYMGYVAFAVGYSTSQQVYFPAPGSATDAVRLLVGNPTDLLIDWASFGGTLGNNVTVQPYLKGVAQGSPQSLNYIISVQAGYATTLVNWLTGDNVRPIYYVPGFQFDEIEVTWNVPAALGTINKFAFYDIQRVAAAPMLSTSSTINACKGTTGYQATAISTSGEPNLTYRWYSSNPYGVLNAPSYLTSGNTFTIPDTTTASPGRKVFYVAGVRNVCGNVISEVDSVVVNVTDCSVTLNAKVFLQGAMPVSGSVMRNDLQAYQNNNGIALLPTVDPYDGSAHYADINNPSGIAGNVVDWVRVEIRSDANPTTVLQSKSLLLKTDGSIVDVDGNVPVFDSQSGAVRVAVKQRNHLAVLSNQISSFASSAVNYDFTTGPAQASNQFGDPIQEVLVNGKYCMIASDITQDYYIDNLDYSKELIDYNANIFDQYIVSDINLDGFVDNLDMSLALLNFNKNYYSTLVNY